MATQHDAQRSPKTHRPPVPIRAADLERLLAAAEHAPTRALLCLLGRLGLRLGEALALEWPSVDLERRTLTVTRQKHGGCRVLGVDDRTAAALEALDRDSVTVLHTSTGRPWQPTHVRRLLKRLSSAAGVPTLRAHGMRHGCALDLLSESRGDLAAVSAALGHRHVSTTDAYLRHGAPAHVDLMRRRG